MSSTVSGTVQINNLIYYKQQNTLFEQVSCSNTYSISSSLPEDYQTADLQPHETYHNVFVIPAVLENGYSILAYSKEDTADKYLDCYTELVDLYCRSGTGSVYFRDKALTGSYSILGTFTGLDLYKNMEYHEMLDVQQLKESAINSIVDPCMLMDTANLNAPINPVKLALLKSNFRLLCRTTILFTKLQNLFISSVFDNTEFYMSGEYKDSTFVDYCFEIFLNKVNTLVPKYKNSIYTFMNQELKKKLESGTDVLDPITNEKIEFDKPITDANMMDNVEKYAKVLFKNEFIFLAQKGNLFFNQQGTDNGFTFNTAPSSSFGLKLFTAKEFFIESIPVFGLDGTFGTYNTSPFSDYTIYQTVCDKKVPSSIKFHFLVEGERVENGYNLSLSLVNFYSSTLNVRISKVTKFYNSDERDNDSLIQFAKNRLTELKKLMIEDDNFLLFSNHMFPLNKILNIASIVHINLMLKTYESMYSILDGSVVTVSNVHDMILGNEDKLDCETPDVTSDQSNIILGINLEILKAIAMFPISVIKGIEETYDPNIFIATKIRAAAESLGAPKLPIIPYSLGLLPVLTIPPPVGIGPPLIPPWGYIYWGIDAGELALEYAKNGFQTGKPVFGFNPTSKNPTKPDC